MTLLPQDLCIAVITSRFNEPITEQLTAECLNTLKAEGVSEKNITLETVPGAFELPLMCQHLAATRNYHAVIALGCVIQGETPHFDYVCSEAARGVLDVSLRYSRPVLFGVLTTDTAEQAWARCGIDKNGNPTKKNKGRDVALAAIEMSQKLSPQKPVACTV